jgi:hypothetical protein
VIPAAAAVPAGRACHPAVAAEAAVLEEVADHAEVAVSVAADHVAAAVDHVAVAADRRPFRLIFTRFLRRRKAYEFQEKR